MIKHVMQLVLVMSAAALLFSCGDGGGTLEPTSADHPTVSKSFSLSVSLSPAVKCSGVATIAAGAYHTVGLKEDGTVVAVGYNGYGQLNVSSWTNIKAIAAGTYHTVGFKEDGTVVAAGFNYYGQIKVSSWTNIKAIAAGTYHTVGLKEDGTVAAVGYIGQMDVSPWTNIKAIAAGAYHTVGLKEDGAVVAVGNNGSGQLNVSPWTNIKAIAAGAYHTVGLKEDGTVVAVGSNDYGQMNVSTWTNIRAIAAGTNHTIGLKEDGTVVAAGSNDYGQMNVSAWTNIMPICEPTGLVANQDVTPPITTAMVTGTLGNNGWYVSNVQITLTATDNDGGSGVKEIHYTVDGTETVVQGSSTSYSIVSDGTHTVTLYAIDNAGNVETPPQEMTINIDKTAPSIPALGANMAILWPPNHKKVNVVLGGSAADSGSGIASTVITVTDEYGIYNMTVHGFGSAIPLESWREGTDLDGRLYTITAVITDNAGNQSIGTTTVLVPHDMR